MKHPRNYWPAGIIMVFVAFISGTIGLVIMACAHRTDLVSDDYYEQEIRFQNQLDRLHRTQPLHASAAYEPATRQIRITLPPTRTGQAVRGRIRLYRPSAAGLDRDVVFKPDIKGIQDLDAGNLRPGLWKVRVFWTAGSQEYFLDEPVIIPSKSL